MQDLKDKLRAMKRELKAARAADARAKAQAMRAVERDEWKAFKAECVRLKGKV